jgi:carbamoyl-phosphate synthase large subunit
MKVDGADPKPQYTVLVSGVGAIMGYGLVRSLRACRYSVRVVGIDVFSDAYGQHRCDAFEQAAYTSSDAYPEFLRGVVARHGIDLFIPGIEQDVRRLGEEPELVTSLGCSVALNSPELIATSHDKWTMHQTLERAGFPTIPTFVEGCFEDLAARFGRPLLLKPRRSYASKGIALLESATDWAYWLQKLGDEFMVQQVVGCLDSEYTVGAFGDGKGGCVNQIAFQRRLSPAGATSKAKVVKDPDLEATVDRLVALLRPVGPTNLQFRAHEGQFLLLEVNPRVSSSTSLRTAFGINEAEMCIEYFLEGKLPEPREVRSGFAQRFIEDHVALCPSDLE